MKPKARKRIVAFRVTEDDYEKLRAASGEDGTRVSELAREGALRFANTPTPGKSVEGKLDKLDQKLDQVLEILQADEPPDPDL